MKKYYYIFVLLIFSSCLKVDCEKLAQNMRNDDFFIIVKNISRTGGYRFDVKGVSPTTGEKIECRSHNGWNRYYVYLSIGDTIIKKKGELIFNIHKKDTVLSLQWECKGKVYK